ncbi:MAG: hypothetical protein SGJ04_02965 [Bacteroidota bacterium]|nr:hypothetical protein [Bacteroidota bacterium]
MRITSVNIFSLFALCFLTANAQEDSAVTRDVSLRVLIGKPIIFNELNEDGYADYGRNNDRGNKFRGVYSFFSLNEYTLILYF